MALKGITNIFLTDIKTGETQVITEENLVTNFSSSLINNLYTMSNIDMHTMKNDYGYMTSFNDLLWSILPLYRYEFGGILLHNDILEELPNNVYPPLNSSIGYAGQNSSLNPSNPLLGVYLSGESGLTPDGTGYKHVWEFGSAQANGVIKSISLTSDKGGMVGWGNQKQIFEYPILNYIDNNTRYLFRIHLPHDLIYQDQFIKAQIKNNNLFIQYFILGEDKQTITIYEVQYPKNLDIVQQYPFITKEIKKIQLPAPISYEYGGRALLFPIYSFQNKDLILTHFGYYTETHTLQIYNLETKIIQNARVYTYNNHTHKGIILNNNYLLFGDQSFTELYNLSLPDKSEKIAHTSGMGSFFISPQGDIWVYPASQNSSYKRIDTQKINSDVTQFSDFMIDTHYANGSFYGTERRVFMLDKGFYLITNVLSNNDKYHTRYMDYKFLMATPYLATINNLQTPIVKDETKSLRIEYTIKNVPENSI